MRQLANMLCGLSIGIFLCSSCTVSKGLIETQGGSYTVQFLKAKTNTDPVVFGSLYNGITKKMLGTNGAIAMNDKIIARTDTNGAFFFRLKPGTHQLTGFGMPYKFLTIKPLEVAKGDSIKILMYLDVD